MVGNVFLLVFIKFKVFNSVIKSIFIYVVDFFRRFKISPKIFFHNKTMFHNITSTSSKWMFWNINNLVSSRGNSKTRSTLKTPTLRPSITQTKFPSRFNSVFSHTRLGAIKSFASSLARSFNIARFSGKRLLTNRTNKSYSHVSKHYIII